MISDWCLVGRGSRLTHDTSEASGRLISQVWFGQSPITNDSSPCFSSVRWNAAGISHAPFARPDPTPIFQREQTDAHDDELARDKSQQRAERLIHEPVRMEANS